MILHDINYPMPIYRDCTLGEMLLIGSIVFISESILFSLLMKLFFGYASIGMAVTMITFFHVTKMSLNRLQKLKYGKPYGYYKHQLIKMLSEWGFLTQMYVTRQGRWSVRRIK